MATVYYNLRVAVDDIESAIIAELQSVTRKEVEEKTIKVQDAVKDILKERTKEPSFRLAHSIKTDIDTDEDGTNGLVYSDVPYAVWVEDGTGIYGPRKALIFPKHSPFMQFIPYGMDRKVRAWKVRGQEPKHMFRDGLRRVVGQGGSMRRMVDEIFQ